MNVLSWEEIFDHFIQCFSAYVRSFALYFWDTFQLSPQIIKQPLLEFKIQMTVTRTKKPCNIKNPKPCFIINIQHKCPPCVAKASTGVSGQKAHVLSSLAITSCSWLASLWLWPLSPVIAAYIKSLLQSCSVNHIAPPPIKYSLFFFFYIIVYFTL